MRPLFLPILASLGAATQNYSPFLSPQHNILDLRSLERRQNCANNGVSCSSLNADGVCCPEDTICANDSNGNVGCCPLNAVCTGTVNGGGSAVTVTNNGGSGAASSTTSNGGFVLGGSTVTRTTGLQTGSLQIPTTGVSGGGSTVEAAGFVFTYIPTSYANAQLCETAYSVCQQQSSACFSSLGGVNGVTVSVIGGGGTTVNGGGSAQTVTNAAGVCSSLSSQACYGIQEAQCTNFGTGGGSAGGVVSTGSGNDAGPRQTACPGMVYAAAGAGVVYGAVRELV